MIIHDNIVQGTPAWRKIRAGIPTASAFSKIVTPKKLELSAQADDYTNKLVAERWTGVPIEDFGGNRATERGKELEPDAIAMYEMLHSGADCRAVGFITNDAATFGCSPDNLVYVDGKPAYGLEMKCPGGQAHVSYLLHPEGAYSDYKPQVQGSLLCTGLPFWDIISYHPEMPLSQFRVYPDLEYMGKLQSALDEIEKTIQEKIKRIKGE